MDFLKATDILNFITFIKGTLREVTTWQMRKLFARENGS